MSIEELGELTPAERKWIEELVNSGFPIFIIIAGIRMGRAGLWNVTVKECTWPKDKKKAWPPSEEYLKHSEKCLLCGTVIACCLAGTAQYRQFIRQSKWLSFKRRVRVMMRRIWRKISRRSK